MLLFHGVISALLLFTLTLSQNVPLRGPPQFESNPQYLDSYIPASMQVIAYLTEMMKYDIKPIVATTTRPVTMTTRRPITIPPSRVTTKGPLFTAPPTPYHKPALYAPYHPPDFIISRTPENVEEDETSTGDSYEEYVNRLKNPLSNYFDRYRHLNPISSIIDQLNRQGRATPFNYTPTSNKPSPRKILSRTTRAKLIEGNRGQNLPVLNDGQQFISLKNTGRSVRSIPDEPIKRNAGQKRPGLRSGQNFDSVNIRQQQTTKVPKTPIRPKSLPSVPRSKRAEPVNRNAVQNRPDLNRGQTFVSLKNTRNQGATNNPTYSRSRSARSTLVDEPSILTSSRASTIDAIVEKSSLIAKDPSELETSTLQLTISTETDKTKARALSINSDSFNARSVDYLGFGLNELVKEIHSEREGGTDNRLTDDDRVKIFSTKYDDVNFGSYLLRQKKIPPTKAYVTLLSLYDLLNKESKKLMLNKYNGYATVIINELVETSTGTSSEQLKIILHRIIDRPDTYDTTIRTKITTLVTDLSTSNSYINDALRYIPPLPFSR